MMVLDAETAIKQAIELVRSQKPFEAQKLAKGAFEADLGDPRKAGAYGYILNQCGEYQEAIKVCTWGLEHQNDGQIEAALKFDRAIAHLSLEKWQQGFKDFMWGLKSKDRTGYRSTSPPWRGGPIKSAKLMLSWEQGFGDNIMMYRFVQEAARQSRSSTFLLVQQELASLFTPTKDIRVTWWEPRLHDYQANLMSLPFLTEMVEPDPTPYIKKYPLDDNGKVGICWKGNPNQDNDWRRSTKPLDWQDVMYYCSSEDIPVVSLQYPPENIPGTHSPDFNDFDELAQLISQLNLVITVDTAVAHLAGAMGKETWVLLSEPCAWQWGRGRTDSAWYRSVRTYRQPKPGEWASVFERVSEDLRARFQ